MIYYNSFIYFPVNIYGANLFAKPVFVMCEEDGMTRFIYSNQYTFIILISYKILQLIFITLLVHRIKVLSGN